MKIAILGESPADEAAVEMLVGAILGKDLVRETIRNYRALGCTSLPKVLPPVLRTLYFSSDADGLVVVVDSNGTTVHDPAKGDEICDPDCRFCRLRDTARREIAMLNQLPSRKPLRFAVGLAVPTIEAWLLSACETGINEIVWQTARKERPPREAYSRRALKVKAYGGVPVPLELEKRKMLEYMAMVVANLDRLAVAFPAGAGSLIGELRSWRVASAHE